ncbi:MAG: dUTP diphosphatase [bacterium]|nr:dUTP diphosphatase [bacterium]
MQEIVLDFTWLDEAAGKDLPLPHYTSAYASGMDVAAALSEPLALAPGAIALVPSGFAVAIPPGFELQVRPRSGLAIKHGITVVNAPGTIDADYRGEIKVGLINLGKTEYRIQRGDRIAQLVLAPVARAQIRPVAQLDTTSRGSGGFGHSGR